MTIKIKRGCVRGIAPPTWTPTQRTAIAARGRKIRERYMQMRVIAHFDSLLKEGSDEPQFTDAQIEQIKEKARLERVAQEDFQKRRSAWRAKQIIDPKETTKRYHRLWRTSVAASKQTLMPQIIHAFSLVEGAAQANDTLALGMEMKNASIDLGAASRLVDKLFNVAYARHALDAFKFPNLLREQILERVVAREFPLMDSGDKQARNKEAELIRALRELRSERESMTEVLRRQSNGNRPQKEQKQIKRPQSQKRIKTFD